MIVLLSPYAFAELAGIKEARLEIGREIASEHTPASFVQLNLVQSKYNKLEKVKDIQTLLKKSLSKSDNLFLNSLDLEKALPRVQVVGNQMRLVSKEGVVRINVVDVKAGKFEINKHIWQLTKPMNFKSDLTKIDQILKKTRVIGLEGSAFSVENAMAIYSLSFIASTQKI